MNRFWLLFIFSLVYTVLSAQNEYWVFFKDKNGVYFDPYEYFSPKAIERRVKGGISLYDSTDFPLCKKYLDEVECMVDSITSHTRWFNGVSVIADSLQLQSVKELPYVKSIKPLQYSTIVCSTKDHYSDAKTIPLLKKQLAVMQGKYFVKNNINGKGIRIAVFDGGFSGVNTKKEFRHLHENDKIIKTYDFTKDDEYVYRASIHGTTVLSCIAGTYDSIPIGLATGAEFLLARTEVAREPFAEEKYWLRAMEWADKNGADIINSSLGYTNHRYFKREMDGKTSLVAKAANMAARKGILVVNAIGNSGDDDWKMLGTPADADSVLAVGGISPANGIAISFSSHGPSYSDVLKPNVSAYGKVMAIGRLGISENYGTSFASPLVAGFAACVWQMNSQMSNMQVFQEIENSGHLYPYFDYVHGYGIPQAGYFFKKNVLTKEKKFGFAKDDEFLKIMIEPKFIDLPQTTGNILYYNIQGNTGLLKQYFVIEVFQEKAVSIPLSGLKKGDRINAHYKGYTNYYEVE